MVDDFDLRAEEAMFPHMGIADIQDDNEEEMPEDYFEWLDGEDDDEENRARWRSLQGDGEDHDWANGWGSDGDVDGDALRSAGFGTDEDYGGGCGDGFDDF
jgi:hypothetical protein